MYKKLAQIGNEYFLMPLLSALVFSMSFFILISMIIAPIALYLGANDGLWNYQRAVSVTIGLPALTLVIFNFAKIKNSILIKVWGNYFSIKN
ncbi:TPA: hypothetical protein JA969_12110 [Legionella pneumophila]|nr:hypothetical protein [Legionella pneumophila]HAT8583763.1 hypothetical protein [Legionella pneumophila]